MKAKHTTFVRLAVLIAVSIGSPALSQSSQSKYEGCLVGNFIEQYEANPSQVTGITDVEYLLNVVDAACFLELEQAAKEYIEIIQSGDLEDLDHLRAVKLEVGKNTILDLTVEIHQRLF